MTTKVAGGTVTLDGYRAVVTVPDMETISAVTANFACDGCRKHGATVLSIQLHGDNNFTIYAWHCADGNRLAPAEFGGLVSWICTGT